MSPDEQFVEKSIPSEYVGLIPAAGTGSRLPNRKLSKEIMPIGMDCGPQRPVMEHLITCMRSAGVLDMTIVLRQDKQDVADYLAEDQWRHVNFDKKMTAGTSGVPESVALGLESVRDKRVAFGFPDILFSPKDAFNSMMSELDSQNSEIVLGLFPTSNPSKMDMVDTDANGIVKRIEIKPERTMLTFTWILAVWTPTFSRFLMNIALNSSKRQKLRGSELHLGHIFQHAMSEGMQIRAKVFPTGRSLDIGTPEDLALAKNWSD